MFITVKALVEKVDEDLLIKNIENSFPEFVWREKGLRSETIEDFEAIDKSRVLITFTPGTGKLPLIIKEDYQSFFNKIATLDYMNMNIAAKLIEISNQPEEDNNND